MGTNSTSQHALGAPSQAGGLTGAPVVVRRRQRMPLGWQGFAALGLVGFGVSTQLDGEAFGFCLAFSVLAVLLALLQLTSKNVGFRLDHGQLTYDSPPKATEIATVGGGGRVVRVTIKDLTMPLGKPMPSGPMQLWIGADGQLKTMLWERHWDVDALDRLRDQIGLPLECPPPMTMAELRRAFPGSLPAEAADMTRMAIGIVVAVVALIMALSFFSNV